MPTGAECLCCCETNTIVHKKQASDLISTCIINHIGFQAACLNVSDGLLAI